MHGVRDDERVRLGGLGGVVDGADDRVQRADAPDVVAVRAEGHAGGRALGEVDLEAVGVQAVRARPSG